jgi:hypothetical protein
VHLKIGALTFENVDYVIDHIAPSCFEEAKFYGKTIEELRFEFHIMIGKPFTASFSTDRGCPCAIFYLESVGVYHWKTHFVYTRTAFKTVGKELTKFFREFADIIIKDTGGRIEIHSAFPESGWFKEIGFSIGGEQKCVVAQTHQ